MISSLKIPCCPFQKAILKSALFSDFNKGENMRFWFKWDESPKITDKFLLSLSNQVWPRSETNPSWIMNIHNERCPITLNFTNISSNISGKSFPFTLIRFTKTKIQTFYQSNKVFKTQKTENYKIAFSFLVHLLFPFLFAGKFNFVFITFNWK